MNHLEAKTTKLLSSILVSAVLYGISYNALADIEIYSDDSFKLSGTLNLQAALFKGDDSWYGAQKNLYDENVDDWGENAAEAGLKAEVGFLQGTLFGEFSWLYTGSNGEDASGLVSKGEDPSATEIEQANIGWKSGNLFSSLDKDALTLKYGNFDYSIGTGMIINDGGGDGGNRGGWWMGARKTFGHSGLISLDTGPWLAEAFYLENRTRRGATKGKLAGLNLEYDIKNLGSNLGSLNLGTSWFRVTDRDNDSFPSYDNYSVRAEWEHESGFELKGEYIGQHRNNVDANGWYAMPAFHWKNTFWSPKLSYRYSHFSGDDLDSPDDEGFKTTAYGSTGWGQWFQGEIVGNYPLDNSNLNTHMLRLELQPTDDIAVSLFYYVFKLNEKHVFGSPVSSKDFADEVNLIVDWSVTDKVLVSGVLGVSNPDDAAKDWTGGNDNWLYSMMYISYSL